MPRQENITIGAVSYTESIATHGSLTGSPVGVHPFFNDDRMAEAARVVEIAAQARDDRTATTAILVRNRSHLADIVPRLREAGLRFRAIEIEGLRSPACGSGPAGADPRISTSGRQFSMACITESAMVRPPVERYSCARLVEPCLEF